jgi:hypothetical protein
VGESVSDCCLTPKMQFFTMSCREQQKQNKTKQKKKQAKKNNKRTNKQKRGTKQNK